MGKRGASRERWAAAKTTQIRKPKFAQADDMDDEIDAFHKQRDIIPLDVDEDVGSADEDDDVQPVFGIEGSDEDEDEDEDEDTFSAKIEKQQKIMRRRTGGVEEDQTYEDDQEEEEKLPWVKRNPYGAEAEPLSSDEDNDAAEEEAEVKRLQQKRAESLVMEDFDDDLELSASDGEKTLEDILPKARAKSKLQDVEGVEDDIDTTYEVKKDLNALSREEQMEVVYSSAPELVGLLSELKDALDQLERKVNPLISKVKKRNGSNKEGTHYLETKQLLMLVYCQAISFYLLLKAEGNPVRDHPVIARLVEIKNMLDKMKQLDDKFPSELEELLNQDHGIESDAKLIYDTAISSSNHFSKDNGPSPVSVKSSEEIMPCESTKLVEGRFSEGNGNKLENHKKKVGLQSMEMLKVRAHLEEKLKQKGVFSSAINKIARSQKFKSQPLNSKLETIDNFDDEVIDMEGGNANLSDGHASSIHSSKLSKLIATKLNKAKLVSGDDDMPKRDDIGERRRKHEIQVLANAGVQTDDDVMDAAVKSVSVDEVAGTDESEDELYKQVKRQRIAKLSAKAELYSRTPAALPTEPEIVDGKRQINRQIEKNRGLTRSRNKLKKNPRKNYKEKYQNAQKRRGGQVRAVKKPTGPYGGEASGINAGISRSIRFKS